MQHKRRIADHAERLFGGVAETLVANRMPVLIAAFLLMAISVVGISKVRVDTSIGNIFTPSDPSYLAYQEYLEEFNSDEVCYVLYSGSGQHGVFDIDLMRSVAELSTVLEAEVPFVDEVISLANIEFVEAIGEDDIQVGDFLADFPPTQEALLERKPKLLAKQNFKNLVISEDGKYAALVIKMSASRLDDIEQLKLDPDGGALSSNLYPSVSFQSVREVLSRPEYQRFKFYLTGDVSINSERNRILTVNNALIVLASLAVVLLLSVFFFNATLMGVVGPLLVVLMSILLTVGVMGFQGWSVGIFFGMVPTLLCAIGVAQSVHILIDYQRHFIETHDRNIAIKEAIRKVGGPCLLAAATTAVSFLVMIVSDMRSLRELAIYAAIGIMATFLISIAVLAVTLSRRAGIDHNLNNIYTDFSIHNSVNSWIESAIRFNRNYPRLVVLLGGVIIVGSALGLQKLQIRVEMIKDFKPEVMIREHTEFVESQMSGNASLVYLIDTGEADGVKSVEFAQRLESFQRYADTIPLVRDSRSINNIVKELNQSFHADQPEWFRLADSQDLLSQYLLVYEFSGGEQLPDFVSQDYSTTALKLRLAMASSQEIDAVIQQLDQYLVENPLAVESVKVTGMGLLWVKIGEYIISTQVTSYLLVFLMIAVVVSIVFGSIKIGLVSMIPNLGPIFVCMGLMGWAGLPLDHFKIMLGTIALGIAVDDTIHLVTRFRSRFMSLGSYDRAMARCLRDVGPALIITTLILVGAFSTFAFSEMQTLASFGYLLAASITLALLADLYLMPCLISRLQLFGPEFDGNEEDVEDIFDRFDASRKARTGASV